MATIYIKKQGETLDSLSPLVTNGSPIPSGVLKGNIITSDGNGYIEDSGVNINDIDAAKLGGLPASDYATKSDLETAISVVMGLDVTITSDMWVLDETTALYKATIAWDGITPNYKVNMVFDLVSLDVASSVKNYTETGDDCFYLYSSSVVADTLTGKAYAKVVLS